jgi:hypothetical protein
MTAISFLLYNDDIFWIPTAFIGQLLLYAAAALTLWSMWTYLQSAWPVISDSRFHVHFHHHDQEDGSTDSADEEAVASEKPAE